MCYRSGHDIRLSRSATKGCPHGLLVAGAAMKPLVASLGKEQVRRIVDLLG